jgi:hypothetical protein
MKEIVSLAAVDIEVIIEGRFITHNITITIFLR